MEQKVKNPKLFALYNAYGIALTFDPASCTYTPISEGKRNDYRKLKIWDYYKKEDIQFWFIGQPTPTQTHTIKKIPSRALRHIKFHG